MLFSAEIFQSDYKFWSDNYQSTKESKDINVFFAKLKVKSNFFLPKL
jgi:hypothetical protein